MSIHGEEAFLGSAMANGTGIGQAWEASGVLKSGEWCFGLEGMLHIKE